MNDSMAIVADRWMLESRQLVNWGSYNGYHEFRPSTDAQAPVTLLAGASESGKSTLVDAQISLLYPTGTPYNKASNSGKSERNDYTYLRGMAGINDSAEGERPVYLRGRGDDGTPHNIWGAIVDTYVNHSDGGLLSCAKFLYLTTGDGKDGLRRRYATWNRKIDPRAMDRYRDVPFTANMLREMYPECETYPNAETFHAAIWHIMGLSAEACRLLHKIQSADAPARLDDIFKQGVLDVPEAIAIARNTVDDYERYHENFHIMEEKIKRVGKLRAIQNLYGEYSAKRNELGEYRRADPETEAGEAAITAWAISRMAGEIRAGIPAAERAIEDARLRIGQADLRIQGLDAQIDAVRERLEGLDNGNLLRLKNDLQRARRDREETRVRRQRLAARFERTSGKLPTDETSWDDMRAALAETARSYDKRRAELDSAYEELVARRAAFGEERERLRRDYERARRQKSRVTDAMADARDLIARATGLDAAELPYVAELMDVKENEERWRTAMNVAYAPIAQTILVDRRHEAGFAAKVSAIDPTHMIRRTWRFVDTRQTHDAKSEEGWLSSKLRYREDSPFASWLKTQTASQRYDAACVDAIDDADERRQVQADGQIKSGAHGFHGTKGMTPVIGFINETYLAQLRERVSRKEREYADVDQRCGQAKRDLELLHDERALADAVADMPWREIDVFAAEKLVDELKTQIDRIEGDPELKTLRERLDELARQRDEAGRTRYHAQADLDGAQKAERLETQWLASHDDGTFDESTIPETVSNRLAGAYEDACGIIGDRKERPKHLAGISDAEGKTPFAQRVVRKLENVMGGQITRLSEQTGEKRTATEQAMQSYLEDHAADDGIVTASVNDYQYFLRELSDLDMLVTRKTTDEEYANSVEKLYMSLQQLNRSIRSDEENIGEQLDRINDMLKDQKFGPREGRLALTVEFGKPQRDFAQAFGAILTKLDDWTQEDRDDATATRKAFASCKPFIDTLKTELGKIHDTGGVRSYGSYNLDPRVRGSFYAIVHHTDEPDERISSTGGKSGGALQELTSFIYGAALIYLLGGDLTGHPTYTTLFLDEALIKADGRYTQRALNVLPRLGFQVIVSAPESKTAEILETATKAYVAYKDPNNGLSSLQELDSTLTTDTTPHENDANQ